MVKTTNTIYQGIYQSRVSGRLKWIVKIKNEHGKWTQHGIYDDEREAAKAYDKHLIVNGKPPVNILKPKN